MLAGAIVAGCSSGPEPTPAPTPPAQAGATPPPTPPSGPPPGTRIVAGAGDSVGALSGAADALFRYRFKQIDPGSDRFVFQDRDLSFYFRPTPAALHFQVENRQNRPVWIEWDRCAFYDPQSNTGKVAHATTTWRDRFGVQVPTQIVGLQRYGDYLLPMDYLVDPAGSDQQLHKPLFPEDVSAPQYTDRGFGTDLVFRIDNDLRTYSFRFKVASVIPR